MNDPTMYAIVTTGHGGFDRLQWRTDVPVPRPRDGEVLVKVGAAGVNNTDINTRLGWYSRTVDAGTAATAASAETTATGAATGAAAAASTAADSGWTGTPLQFPRIQGADACGRIVAVGPGVDPGRIGDRVLVEPVFRPPGSTRIDGAIYFGSECDGAFAEYARVPSRHAHRISSALSDAELASFPCAYSAAENMVTRAVVTATDTVLVVGASGGVGSAAVQLARRRGATVIAVADAVKAGALTSLGAVQVVDRNADLVAALGTETVDVIIDVVGGEGFPARLDVLVRGGRYAVSGAIAGPVVPLDLRTLYLKDLTFFGCTVLGENVFQNLISYVERGEIVPLVAATYPLPRIADAQRAFMDKRHVGKIVLVPPEA